MIENEDEKFEEEILNGEIHTLLGNNTYQKLYFDNYNFRNIECITIQEYPIDENELIGIKIFEPDNDVMELKNRLYYYHEYKCEEENREFDEEEFNEDFTYKINDGDFTDEEHEIIDELLNEMKNDDIDEILDDVKSSIENLEYEIKKLENKIEKLKNYIEDDECIEDL